MINGADPTQAVASLLYDNPGRILAVADGLRGHGRVVESTVSGGSMGATLPNGTRIRIDLSGQPRADMGRVVAAVIGSNIVVHRVIGRGQRGRARPYILTRGDALLVPDLPFIPSLVLGQVTGMLQHDNWVPVGGPPSRRRRGRAVQLVLLKASMAALVVSPRIARTLVTSLHATEAALRRSGRHVGGHMRAI